MAFVYMAGLEHTGHHLWHNTILPRVRKLRFENAATLAILRDEEKSTISTQTDIKRTIANAARSSHKSTVFFIASCSYPCHSEKHNPNMTKVVSIQRELHVQPKIIVMLRAPLHEIVHTFNRNRLRVLGDACRALYRDVSFLKPGEFTCLDYHKSVEDAERISRFIGVNVTQAMVDGYRPTNNQNHSEELIRHMMSYAEWRQLSSCDLQIRALCPFSRRNRV